MTTASSTSTLWARTAMTAALVILLSPVLYLLISGPPTLPEQPPVSFVGSGACRDCHRTVYDKWRGSHHDLAMDEADEHTVLGDFNDVDFTDPYNHVTSHFFRRDGKFLVKTEGPDGNMREFEIAYTFGAFPLQQYLIPFPGGRLQCLNIAWDVERRTWYRLPPYEVTGPDDWLHWTKGGQTWNVMCAECHSTSVRKGYDPDNDTYQTTWAERDVGCEACHGPGSKHVEWAKRPPLARKAVPNDDLIVRTSDLDAAEQLRICAPCHSRRFQLGDNPHGEGELLDLMVPLLLEDGLYYPDGQILEEVYVFGSFVQSKMYNRNVRCSDCHDVHSLKRHKEGNELCTQCHRAEDYDTPNHHFHKTTHEGKPSKGHLCVSCHMPERTFMGIDERADHSLRIPRPDLSERIDAPNACMARGCHDDKPLEWNIKHVIKWYGESTKPHYGTVFADARNRKPEAQPGLLQIADDPLLPAVVRATALELLRAYPTPESRAALTKALEDEEALLRYTAIRSLEFFDAETRLKRIAPKLYDPVRAVRDEAAAMLSGLAEGQVRPEDQEAFRSALASYRQSMLYNADLAPQRYNLGNLAFNSGDEALAEAEYLKALRIDGAFYPAKVNLAVLYNRQGKNQDAERLLREVADQEQNLYEVAYSLGLLLAEMGRHEDAAIYLGRAAAGMGYARAYYNQGLNLLALRRFDQAEQAFVNGLALTPRDEQLFAALANLYLRNGQTDKARSLAVETLRTFPDHVEAGRLVDHLGK